MVPVEMGKRQSVHSLFIRVQLATGERTHAPRDA